MRLGLRGTLAVMLASAAAPSAAEWKEATSRHFVVYSELPTRELKQYVSRLEQFDGVVREIQASKDPEPSAANRLTVYMVKSVADVQRLAGREGVAGFYLSRAEGVIGVVPERGMGDGQWALDADTIFFHEYAHHLMLQNLDVVYPKWLVEGYAEFLSTVQFEKDGQLRLGRPADHRMYEILLTAKLSYSRLLENEDIRPSDPTFNSFYGRSWILTHYFMFTPERQKQLASYLTLLNQNVPGPKAAAQAFGNLGKLNGEVESYLRKPARPFARFDATKYASGPIKVRTLRPGEDAVFTARIQSKVGVDKKRAAKVVDEVRRIADQYPNDPIVLASLAEAELDIENFPAARQAADRALALDPRSIEAMIFKGRALTWDPAKKANEKAFEEARAMFIAANKIDTEDPEPLKYFWESYWRQGVKASANAANALHYASQLVPQDMELRIASAWQHLQDGNAAMAGERLAAIASSPHEGKRAEKAQEVLQKIAAKDSAGAAKILRAMIVESERPDGKVDD